MVFEKIIVGEGKLFAKSFPSPIPLTFQKPLNKKGKLR